MEKGFVVASWYVKNIAHYAVRFESGRKQVFQIASRPYFYVPSGSHIPEGMKVQVEEGNFVGIDGVVLKRLYTELPYDVRSLREEFANTYEADIPYVDRVRYDRGIKAWVDENFNPVDCTEIPKLRIVFLDIEVDDSKGFPDPKQAQAEILTVVIYDNIKNKYIVLTTEPNPKLADAIKFNSEEEMIKGFAKIMDKLNPDIVTGWNVENFDVAYLMGRFGHLLENTFRTCTVLDLLSCYMKLHENDVRSYALDYIAKLELGRGKTEHKSIKEEYEKGTLSEYCLNDVQLCVELNKKLGLIDFVLNIVTLTGCRINDALFNSNVVDAFMFFELQGKIIQKTKKEHKDDTKLTGAMVIEPKPGIYEWVAEIDNSSEYPNIMLSWGLSPDRDGRFLKAMQRLMELRKQYKKSGEKDKERAVKFLINSFSGVLGCKTYRNYSPDVFNKITELARKHLMWNAEFFKSRGFEVLYGDTDSVYVWLKSPDVNPHSLVEDLNRTFPEFHRREGGTGFCTLSTKLENVYKRILFMPVKKKYAGITTEGKLKIRGFEVRRSNVAVATSKIQEKVLWWLLEGLPVNEVKKLAMEAVKHYELIDLGIPCALRKNSYAVETQHLRAARWSNENLGKNYSAGSKFLVFFVKGIPDTDVIAVDFYDAEILKKFQIDMSRQIERAIKSPLEQIFAVVEKKVGLEGFV